MNTIKKPLPHKGMRKVVSTGSLPDMENYPLEMLTHAHILQVAQCELQYVASKEVDKKEQFISCIAAPDLNDEYEPIKETDRMRYFLQLASEKKDIAERYNSWLRRIRKKSDESK